jgi:hypothetical protein
MHKCDNTSSSHAVIIGPMSYMSSLLVEDLAVNSVAFRQGAIAKPI